MSLLDLKAGFHNVPLTYETSLKVSFVCHKGRYKWLRMPFGLQEAPAHFQMVMESILGEDLPVSVYLDDIGLRGNDLDLLLQQTLEAIRRLAAAGCMLNLGKSVIGTT
jgi:ribonuclease HI